MRKLTLYFLRFTLAASFLSAVADRFGFWGEVGSPGVVWGNFEIFKDYTGSLLFFLPKTFVSFFAWIATIIEVLLSVLLVIGLKLKEIAFVSGLLLGSFALSMTLAYGIKSPLDYSVFTACAASFALALFAGGNYQK